jgi:16S rRNA C1402 N4-methylase RsmH
MRDAVLRLWLPDRRRRRRRRRGDGDVAGEENVGNDDNRDDVVDSTTVHLIDGTMGLGGHTSSVLASEYDVRVLGIDRDASALSKARRRIEIETSPSSSEEENEGGWNVSRAHSSRVAYHHGSFADVSPGLLRRHSFPPGGVDGMLVDLGMNSDQLDDDERGFTFRKRGPLDMRFDASSLPEARGGNEYGSTKGSVRAGDIVNGWSASQLSRIVKAYADEPYAIEIAGGIVRWRESLPWERGGIRSTLELRYVIEEAVEGIVASINAKTSSREENDGDSFKKGGKRVDFERYRAIWHPPSIGRMSLSWQKTNKLLFKYEERKPRHPNNVMRCFQALRIAANDELNHIETLFESMLAPPLSSSSSSSPSSSPSGCCLAIGGRLVAIAFHPGEDRLVKEGMARMVDTGRFHLLTPEEDGLRPTFEEVKNNGRSRTARLRAVERVR